ncbi:MAG: prolyl oligopeptidase family serine peptidase [Bacteroidota bacterium]|nr:prolyl oligopeptidase family serine peptidase [Bacteroidota bacterium]
MLKKLNFLFNYTFVVFVLYVSFVLAGQAQCQTALKDTVVLKEGLVIKLGRPNFTKIISPNAVIAQVETGQWKTPSDGETLEFNGKTVGTWRKVKADDNGWIKDDSLLNAYVYFQYKSDKDEVVIMEAMGHSLAYINGSARSGNPYRTQDTYGSWGPRFDYSLVPVKLHKGVNELLFECNREGVLKIKLHKSLDKALILNTLDLTIPDLILNEASDTYGALPIINTTEESYTGLSLKTWGEDINAAQYYPVTEINSLSVVKTPFKIVLPKENAAGKVKLHIAIVRKDNKKESVLASDEIELNVRKNSDTHKETFISQVDGSVQYYAVNPPVELKQKPALFLSLHGAGVEAIDQAGSYGHKNWGYIVAPTNRRPYGFNWENWGRLDGLEVLNIAKKKFNIDPNRVYLTGHSMGGHGTWQLGVNYADQFGAIAPSAGWISFWSYRVKPIADSSDVNKMLTRSTKQSDTYAFSTNLKPNGIYILQGDADDNVPPDQARSMVANLSKFHKDYIYYEQPGAGHWWDNSDEDGADVVDWMPIFDFFSHHSVAPKEDVRMVDFVTANPAVSSKNYWVEVINQIQQQKLSKVSVQLQFGKRKFIGTTSNVELFSIDASMLRDTASVELDGQLISSIKLPEDGKLYFFRDNGKWTLSQKPDEKNKYPVRCGNFREVLNYRPVFVFGTHGDKEENKWAFEKARADAEKLWYQGNGTIEVIKDSEFDLAKYKDRNVVLFGNSKTNSAWNLLLKDSPIQVNNGKIKAGSKEFKGKDLSCLFIRPRSDSKFASVAAISGTGLKGMQLSNVAPYYSASVNLPDVVVYNSDIVKSDEQGVVFTGYFGNDWSVDKGDFFVNGQL